MNRPFVRLKIAASLDGRTALNNGVSQWITSPEARADGHRWRAQADAILTGAGTVLADDPLLNVRGVEVAQQPALVIVDSRLETPPTAKLFGEKRQVFIYAAQPDAERQQALQAAGATVVLLPEPANAHTRAKGPKVDLPAMMADLYTKGIGKIHVEAGQKLNGSLVDSMLADEIVVYLAPKFLGEGIGMMSIQSADNLEIIKRWVFVDSCTVGTDLRCILRPS